MRSGTDDVTTTSGSSRRRRLAVAIATGTVLAGAAILPANGGAVAARPASSRVAAGKITYTKQTVLVPTATVNKQLAKVSSDGATYTFKSSHGVLGRLKKGSVMLLQGLAVRDVTKVAHSHGKLIVSSTPAAITDLISNGTLSWDKSLRWANAFGVRGTAVADPRLRRTHTITIKGTTHSYTYTATFKEEKKAVAVSISISQAAPVKLSARITGTLDNITSSGQISVHNGALSTARLAASHVVGRFALSYSAKPDSVAGVGSIQGPLVELPAELAVPFAIGPVPLFVGIKFAFVAGSDFADATQSVSGAYSLGYSGAGGIKISKAGLTSKAGLMTGSSGITLNATNATTSSPLGFSFGARMPELDLGLGAKGLSVAANLTSFATTGVANQGGCDTRLIERTSFLSADASFFGFSSALENRTLFDKTVQASYPKGCGVFP